LVEEISLNLAYRWYIGYDLDEVVPNHSIFSKARARFGKTVFTEIFSQILKTAISYGIVSREVILVYSSIIKADASAGSIVEINLSPEEYWRKLDESEKIKSPAGRKSKSGTPVNTGSHFKGEPDKDKMGKGEGRPILAILRKNRLPTLTQHGSTDPEREVIFHIKPI